jgi:hypothetical protein
MFDDVLALWKKLNTQYPANESNLMATLVIAAEQTKMVWDPVALWDTVSTQTANMDAQRVARGKLHEANATSILNQRTIASMENQLYNLDNSTRTFYTGIELHGKMLFPLIAAYNRVEELDPETFWNEMIERNPLTPKILSIIRQKNSHIPSDPSCAQFWMALRNCPARLLFGENDWLDDIPPDCWTSKVIATLDYLSEAESQDPTVRKKQHRLLNSLNFEGFNFIRYFNSLVVDDRFPWCPMRYLACKCISDGKRFGWAFMIAHAIWPHRCRRTQNIDTFSIDIGSVTGKVNHFLSPSSEGFALWYPAFDPAWGGIHNTLERKLTFIRRTSIANGRS